VDGNFGNAMASLPQSRNGLEDRRGKDDEMPKEVWKIVEIDIGKIGVAEAEGERGKGESRKEMKRNGMKKKKQ